MDSKEIESAVNESLAGMDIEMKAVHVGLTTRENNWECDAWRITFTHKMRRNVDQTFDFYTGLGHRKAPSIPYYMKHEHPSRIKQWKEQNGKPVKSSAASVLYSLVMDASANDQSFNDWCSNFGYDTDSMKAFNTYQACCNISKQLYTLFTHAQIEALRELLQDY